MIALVGLVLRLVDAGARINDDEGYSWLVASAPSAGAFLSRLARFENTPPLFYLLLTPLPLSSEVWLRLLSELTAGPNGDGSGATGETDVMCYDEAGRLTQVNQSLSPNVNGESGFDTDQTYDANGNVTSRSVNGNLGQTACPPAGDTQSPPSYSGGQQTTFVYNNLDEEKSMSVQSTSGVSPAQPSRTYTTTNHCTVIDDARFGGVRPGTGRTVDIGPIVVRFPQGIAFRAHPGQALPLTASLAAPPALPQHARG